MLSPKTQYNLANAQTYFEEHLCVGDYYSERERVRGEWLGNGAEMLGLRGFVGREAFLALCENLHPQTGERLTVRHKTTRKQGTAEVANRRVFFDFTFSPPKSVSIAALVGGDARISDAHAAAVREALVELEKFAAAQVHRGAQHGDRVTGNVLAALFQHDTSRALDPHLHTHCILFNATHDPAEQRWKALHNHGLLVAQKFAENVYYHRLAQRLIECGYTVVNHARGDFELEEIPADVRRCFSKRHQEIDAKTFELLASTQGRVTGTLANIRKQIAHKDRAQKLAPLALGELRKHWLDQLDETTRQHLHPPSPQPQQPTITAHDAVLWAEEHLFQRRSVVAEHEVLRHALAFGRGHDFTLQELRVVMIERPYLQVESGHLSRADVLAREWRIVEIARDGAEHFPPLTSPRAWHRADLDADQQRAFARIVSSRDEVTLFRGSAGTGKSHVLRRVHDALLDAQHPVTVLAPQRQQVLDLQRDGLTNGQTVAEFLQRRELARGSVLIVDEAGQIGGKQFHDLLELAHRTRSRVILSGDTRQHGPVEASDALRAIERYSGLHPAELNHIRRQDPARAKTKHERQRIANYREAVQHAADGDAARSFSILENAGAITECPQAEMPARLAEAYLQLTASGESALVVSQTRQHVAEVNDSIRAALQRTGKVTQHERIFDSLTPVDLTNAQKADPRFYPPDALLTLRRANGREEVGKLFATPSVEGNVFGASPAPAPDTATAVSSAKLVTAPIGENALLTSINILPTVASDTTSAETPPTLVSAPIATSFSAHDMKLGFTPAPALNVATHTAPDIKSAVAPATSLAFSPAGILAEFNGKLRLIRPEHFDKLTVCHPQPLAVSVGDRLQIKANGKSLDGRKLANGEIVTVAHIAKTGLITLRDARKIPPDFRRFTRGYAVTSYASQGKTVEHLLFADSASRPATSAEQWYVTISRARKSIHIFTPDKPHLAAAIQHPAHPPLALDLLHRPARDLAPSRKAAKLHNQTKPTPSTPDKTSTGESTRALLLRGVKRGYELARRICLAVSHRPSSPVHRPKFSP